jgi:hypothetical protein
MPLIPVVHERGWGLFAHDSIIACDTDYECNLETRSSTPCNRRWQSAALNVRFP